MNTGSISPTVGVIVGVGEGVRVSVGIRVGEGVDDGVSVMVLDGEAVRDGAGVEEGTLALSTKPQELTKSRHRLKTTR